MIILSIGHALSQTYIPSGIYLNNGSLEEAAITNGIKNSGLKEAYTAEQWQENLAAISRFNSQLDMRIMRCKADRSDLASKRQQLLGIQDVAGLKQQLADKKKTLEQVPVELEKALQDIGFRSNYICVIKSRGLLASQSEQLEYSQGEMARIAIPQLNGAFLQSITQVQNGLLEERVVRQWVKGKMTLQGSPFYSNLSRNQKYFVLGAMVEVSPLKTGLSSSGDAADGDRALLCINLQATEAEVKKQMLAIGLDSSDVRLIYLEYQNAGAGQQTQSYNKSKNEQVQRLNREAKIQAQRLQLDIEELEEKLKAHDALVTSLMESLQMSYAGILPSERLEKVSRFLQVKMKQLEDSIYFYLSKRFETFESPVRVTGSIPEDMARSATGGLSQLRTRKAITGYTQYVEVKNGLVTGYEEGKEVIFEREVQEIWLYVIAGSHNEYTMGMVARYKLSSLSDGTEVTTLPPAKNLPAVLQNLVNNMVYVQGGTFTMGCTSEQGGDCDEDEKPAHQVTLSSFKMGKYEVTQAEWEAVMGSNPSFFYGCPECPVETVSWDDIQLFLQKLNTMTGGNYRLPTEAEWEYAARGGNRQSGTKYSGSDNIDAVAWYYGNSGAETHPVGHPVGQKQANALGLYDMSGNVWEWCSDWYEYYSSSPLSNPRGPSSGTSRVLRGGSWDIYARHCRVSYRYSYSPEIRNLSLGFRLVSPGS